MHDENNNDRKSKQGSIIWNTKSDQIAALNKLKTGAIQYPMVWVEINLHKREQLPQIRQFHGSWYSVEYCVLW